jgi:methyltransferase (TIGR00027 family)
MKPIADMAFYCCGARMQDAAQDNPICGDDYAKLFMCEYGMGIFDRFKSLSLSNAGIIVRHRIMDDMLRQMLNANHDLNVVTIGAGFDSRPYRLEGGHWFELDEPQLIAYKDIVLPPAQCANPLHREPIDFDKDNLEDKLLQLPHTGPVVFVLEGVVIYLCEYDVQKLLTELDYEFPRHLLLCDLVSREVVGKYGQTLQALVAQMGAPFQATDHPEDVFLQSGYQPRESISVVEGSVDLGINRIPKFFWRSFFQAEISGNAVCLWEKDALSLHA